MHKKKGKHKKFSKIKKGGHKSKSSHGGAKIPIMLGCEGLDKIPPKNLAYPEGFLVHMKYTDPQGVLNNAAALFASVRFRMNSVYDPDPTLGGGTVDGYTFYSTIYGRYRVVGFKYKIAFDNNDAFEKRAICWPSMIDLGSNYSATDQASELPYSKMKVLSSKGGGSQTKVISGFVPLAQFYGEASYNTGETSLSNYNSNPSLILYFNVGTSSGTVLSLGTGISVTLGYVTKWTSRETITNFHLPENRETIEKWLNFCHNQGQITNKELHEKQKLVELRDKIEAFKEIQTLALTLPGWERVEDPLSKERLLWQSAAETYSQPL